MPLTKFNTKGAARLWYVEDIERLMRPGAIHFASVDQALRHAFETLNMEQRADMSLEDNAGVKISRAEMKLLYEKLAPVK